jgi:rare lipoprotein A
LPVVFGKDQTSDYVSYVKKNGGTVGNRRIAVNTYLLAMILIFFLIGCAREAYYIRAPDGSQKRVLAVPDADKKMRPYVVNGERYYPLSKADGFVQYGKASWYGGEFHGLLTANGETYDMNKKTAAHKTLPMGTYVKVLNLSNNEHCVVRINDRGPFVKGRIIDLSYAVAKEVGLIGPGVADVKIVALGREVGMLDLDSGPTPLVEVADLKTGDFTIQIGAFTEKKNALEIADRLGVVFDYVHIAVQKRNDGRKALYKVHVSRSETLSKAGEIEKRLENMGFTEAFVVRI